jgi:hypothetical protein
MWAPALLAATVLSSHVLVLDYADFAPQAAGYELIGFEWNQWRSEGHPDPEDVPVKVAVYRGTALSKVKKAYPVVRGVSDYRYVRYDQVLKFLGARLREMEAPPPGERLGGPDPVIARYRSTKQAIEAWGAASARR